VLWSCPVASAMAQACVGHDGMQFRPKARKGCVCRVTFGYICPKFGTFFGPTKSIVAHEPLRFMQFRGLVAVQEGRLPHIQGSDGPLHSWYSDDGAFRAKFDPPLFTHYARNF
jgi:hypothetical protein